ncbi:MAG: caspase family protein [Bacteroidales bacterium]|nr:caspase family protein [Bacteroidales bacterium]
MKMKIFIGGFILLFVFGVQGFSQNAKKYYKTGQEFLNKKAYQDAIDQFSKAIELKPEFTKAYVARAEVYERMDQPEKALDDYKRALVFVNKDAVLYYRAGKILNSLGRYQEAVDMLNHATRLEKKPMSALQEKVKALMALKKYREALYAADSAKKIRETPLNYYLLGQAHIKLSNLNEAEQAFRKAANLKSRYTDVHLALANLYLTEDKADQAIKECNYVLSYDNKNTQAYLIRSKVYVKQLDMPNAINDISRILLIEPDNPEMFFLRGKYYQQFNQHINAITDFTKVISLRPDDPKAYMARARSYEDILDYKSAEKDYKAITKLTKNDAVAVKMLKEAQKRLYELNRESDKPEISLMIPEPDDSRRINVSENKKDVILKGKVKDQSDLEYLKINGQPAHLDKKNGIVEFLANVELHDTNEIMIEASDIYHNIAREEFFIRRTEVNPPEVAILAPYASDNGEIYLESPDPELYIEGKVHDESPIKTIMINGIYASYKPDEVNPHFSATINIMNKDHFTVTAEDIYGNKSTSDYKLNREGVAIAAENPMGKTWAVFIENSNYQTFASLDGPPKDISLMKKALARYRVSNIIVKKDMTKEEMGKFFSIELRDLVRSNHVNSILIWYAGHGKFINETGYWIPVDAKRDDEFTYFNISNLKGALQAYAKWVTHILVITDACESGPTFYQAMRSIPEVRSCDDWKATRFKSSQVFSSAGYELAVDNSQFTRTFANTLLNNPDACIPIESIVRKVTKAVVQNDQQKPQFGKIAGLEDEDGTFFFIAK